MCVKTNGHFLIYTAAVWHTHHTFYLPRSPYIQTFCITPLVTWLSPSRRRRSNGHPRSVFHSSTAQYAHATDTFFIAGARQK